MFYKQCFSLDNLKLLDTIAEAITTILFTACGGMVHYLVRALFSAQHQDSVTDLDRIMYEYTNVFRLADMKMCHVKLEMISNDELTVQRSMVQDSQGSGDSDRPFSPMSPFSRGYGTKSPAVIPRQTFKDKNSRPLIKVQEMAHSPDHHHSNSLTAN